MEHTMSYKLLLFISYFKYVRFFKYSMIYLIADNFNILRNIITSFKIKSIFLPLKNLKMNKWYIISH